MSITNVIAIVLIVLGAFGLAYGGFTYTSQDKVAQIGDLKITASTEKTVPLPPVLGAICLVGGIILLVISRQK